MNPFRRLWIAIASQFRKLATALHLMDPISVQNRKIEIAAETVNRLRGGLEELQGKTAGLAERIAELEGEEKRALAMAKRAKDAGDDTAGRELAGKVASIRSQLAAVRQSHDAANQAYKNNLQQIRAAHTNIAAAKEHAVSLKDKYEMAKLDHAIAGISESLNIDPSMSLDSAEIDKAINDKIHTLKAKAIVQQDLAGPPSASAKYANADRDQEADDIYASL